MSCGEWGEGRSEQKNTEYWYQGKIEKAVPSTCTPFTAVCISRGKDHVRPRNNNSNSPGALLPPSTSKSSVGDGVGGNVSPGASGAFVTGAMVGVLVTSIYCVPRAAQVSNEKETRREKRNTRGDSKARVGEAGRANERGGMTMTNVMMMVITRPLAE